jgi:predicted acetyltransferase
VSLVWDFARNWSVQAGGIATVAGANTLRERGYFAAIWKRF